MDDRATIDFESKSACSLRRCGSWRYSLDPTTEPLCMAFHLPYWDDDRTGLWHPAFPHLDIPESDNDDLFELFDWISDGGLVEAHNAWFERGIWTNIMSARLGWPLVQNFQWRCSAAKAAAHALPRALGDATAVLRLSTQKDAAGHKLMMKVSQPRKPRKAEREAGVTTLLWWESRELFEDLWAYCRQDVLAESALSAAIPDLNVAETEIYLLDQTINERGFQLDGDAVDLALRLIANETKILTKELEAVTDGQVAKATQRAQMLAWFASEGLDLENTQKETLDDVVVDPALSPKVKRGLELVRTLGRSSTAKYQSMKNWRSPADNRVRGGLLYHGAGTGRWSGAGVQPHNFLKGSEGRMGLLWDVLKTEERETIQLVCGDVMEALANGLRGAIVAAPGHQLYVADYAAIEARCVLWLAGDEDALGIFRRHEDIYKDMAADIYDIPMAEVTGDQRQHGKQAVLGCGYQMGWSKFQATCAKYGIIIDDPTAQRIVEAYRAKYWRVVDMWKAQNDAAMMTVRTGKPHTAGKVTWLIEGRFLYCELPSKRRLAYPFPEIRMRSTPWGAEQASLTFMGVNSYTRKWVRQTTYGGSLVENCLAGDTPVLTQRGWRELCTVTIRDKVWDGVEWVTHAGVVSHGIQPTLVLEGVTMTPEHRVLTTQGWAYAAHTSRLDWAPNRRPNGYSVRRIIWGALAVASRLCAWAQQNCTFTRYTNGKEHLSPMSGNSGRESNPSALSMGQYADSLLQSTHSVLSPLRRAGHYCLRAVEFVSEFLDRYAGGICAGVDARPNQQRWALRAEQLSLGDYDRTSAEYQQTQTQAPISATRGRTRAWFACHIQPALPGPSVEVFDLVNCGPRQRFTIKSGRLVHNCTQAVARDLMAEAMLRCEQSGTYKPVLSVHDELIAEAVLGTGSVSEFEQLMAECPEWAQGCPIEASGFCATRYKK